MARVAGLDRARIVAASLALADADGLDSLTMRRLSAELGVTPMAIYHHVSSKEQLLDLVVDQSLGTLGQPDEDASAAEALVAWFSALYELLVAHPALAHAVAGRRLEGEAAAGAATGVLRIVDRAGFAHEDGVELLVSLVSFTMGSALYRISRNDADARYGERRIPEPAAAEGSAIRRLVGAGLRHDHFHGGLRRLVDGYFTRV